MEKKKLKKIIDIISKILLAILIAFVVFVLCLALFKSCNSAVDNHVAYASESDGLGLWEWQDSLSIRSGFTYSFDFVSNSVSYDTISGSYRSSTRQFSLSYISSVSSNLNIEVYNSTILWSNQAYRLIDIKSAPPAEFLTILQANAVYQGSGEPEPEPVTYTITNRVANGSISGSSTIQENGSVTLTITPNVGYSLPDSVSVTNATFTYDKSTGTIVVSNPTGNVTVFAINHLIESPDNIVVGKYVFKNTIDLSAGTWTVQDVNFSITLSNGETSNFTRLRAGAIQNAFVLWFGRPNNGVVSDTVVYSSIATGNTQAGWVSPIYQTIDFGSTRQVVSPEFYKWLTENTLPQGLDADSYNIGYNAGLSAGQSAGYSAGYTAGQSAGYSAGYDAGLADGQSNALSGAEGLIAGTSNLFAMKIFGTFSILDILLLVFGIGIGIWFLKMFAGG